MARRVTASDVAVAAGVSRATVSFVLNATPGQTISEGVRRRVADEASRLGYKPHTHARALSSGSSRIILVQLPPWPVEYTLRQILDEASAALDGAGYTLVTTSPFHRGHARPLWETLQPDAVLPIDPLPAAEAAAITAFGIPVVQAEADAVEIVRGVDVQFRHLFDRGHRTMAYAATTVAGMGVMNGARKQHTTELCAAAGISLLDASIDESSARAAVDSWLSAGVTGVICFNDDTAARVLGAAVRSGLRVPADLAIIGHDDSPIADLLVPALTTVRFDTTGLGRHLAAAALAVANGEPLPLAGRPPIHASVVERETT